MEQTIDRYRTLLREFVAFRSISTDPACASETRACAQWLGALLGEAGFAVRLVEGYGNPIIVARYDAGARETCLIYGHYDVQPAAVDDGGGWSSDPFVLTEGGGRFYARGAVDNKGQLLIHVVSVLSLIEEGKLGYNVTFVIEGDEETGGEHIGSFVSQHAPDLACDCILISDGEGVGTMPAFEISFRGVFNAEVRIRTALNDLHSGLFGGYVANAGAVAAMLAARLPEALPAHIDDGAAVLGPGLARPPQSVLDAAPPFDTAALASLGALCTAAPETVAFTNGFMPSIEVTGLAAGYTGVGFRNAIPAQATLKLNVRLGPGQDAQECAERFKEWVHHTLRELLPAGASFDVSIPLAVDGVELWSRENQYLARASAIVESTTGAPAFIRPCGAAIPIVLHFARILEAPQVLLSLGNPDCNMHGVDENIALANVRQGIAISREFLRA